MKVFISWSGARSHSVAKALREWLPFVIQQVQPWLSSSDIRVGSRWQSELQVQLQESRVGLICLTPENITASWILFEVGMLAARPANSAFICPYLLKIKPYELSDPLKFFQAAAADREGTKALILTLNRALGEQSLSESVLDKTFNTWWPDLASQLED